jgi:cytochrome c peroxidase
MRLFKFTIQLSFLICFICSTNLHAADLTSRMEELGMQIFFDKNLSKPRKQSCASCHDPRTGFTSPNFFINMGGATERGAVKRRFGNRRPPSASYATFTDNFAIGFGGAPVGGNFWDGRATGEAIGPDIFPLNAEYDVMRTRLGSGWPAADQAMAPFLNDVEQNLPSAEVLCNRVKHAHYANLYADAWGGPINCSEPVFIDEAHKRIAFSVAVFEASDKVNSFSSKRDQALADDEDGEFPLDGLSDQENEGHDLFFNTNSAGGPPPVPTFVTCGGFCHSSSFTADGTDPQELYTSTSAAYFNIGVPRNPLNKWYKMNRVRDDNGNIINPLGKDWVDLGVAGAHDGALSELIGEFKMPTLRNTGKVPFKHFVKAYMHNGYFKSLKQVVHFYNTRDMKPVCTNRKGNPQKFVTARKSIKRGCWPVPETFSVDEVGDTNIFQCDQADNNCKVELVDGETFEAYCDNPENSRNIGNLCLTGEQEDSLVAYIRTLTDLETMKPPKR